MFGEILGCDSGGERAGRRMVVGVEGEERLILFSCDGITATADRGHTSLLELCQTVL